MISTETFTEPVARKEFNPKEPSKVINADGTPKIVYHGTNGDFTIFKVGIAGGIYFAGDRNVAEKFTKKGRVIEAYLDIKNTDNN